MRSRYKNPQFTYDGLIVNRVPNATVTVYSAGTGTLYPGTLWATLTGTDPVADVLPNPFATGTDGVIEFYLDVPDDVKLVVTAPSIITPLTADFEPVMPTAADIVTDTRIEVEGILFRDRGGHAFDVDLYGADPSGATSSLAAFQAAAAAAAPTKGIVQMGRGIYILDGRFVLPTGCTLAGLGPAATTIRRVYDGTFNGAAPVGSQWTYDWLITCANQIGVRCTLRDFTLDGNYAANMHVGVNDIDMMGTDNAMINVVGVNSRDTTVSSDGVRTAIIRCQFIGPNIATSTSNGNYNTHGIMLQGIGGYRGLSDGWLIYECSFINIATPGAFPAGSNGRLIGNVFDNCHVHWSDIGGGQFGVNTNTIDAANNPKNTIMIGNHLKPSTGHLTLGFEIDHSDGFLCANNIIEGQGARGITVTDGCNGVIANNVVRNCGQYASVTPTAGIWIGGGNFRNITNITVTGNRCYDDQAVKTQAWGIYVHADTPSNPTPGLPGYGGPFHSDSLIITDNDCTGNINAAGISINGTGTQKIVWGNLPVFGPSLMPAAPVFNANVVGSSSYLAYFRNPNAGGSGSPANGVQVLAGSTGFDDGLVIAPYNWGGTFATAKFHHLLNGQFWAQGASGTTTPLVIGNAQVAAAILALFGLYRQDALKASVGLDASDRIAFLGSGGASVASIDPANGNMVLSGDLAVTGPYIDFSSGSPIAAPTLTQNIAVAVTVNEARYRAFGKWAALDVQLTATAAGSAVSTNTPVTVTVPATLASARAGVNAVIGSFTFYDASAFKFFTGQAIARGAQSFSLIRDSRIDYFGNTNDADSVQIASGDIVILHLNYRIA